RRGASHTRARARSPVPHARCRQSGWRCRDRDPRGARCPRRRRAALGLAFDHVCLLRRGLRDRGRVRSSRAARPGERGACRRRGAPLMFGVGPEELVLVLIVALLVLGPERLPRMARDVGRVVGELRRTSDEFRAEFLNADKYLEKPASAPAAVALLAVPPTTPRDPNESAFDREMREARERLAASREKPAT